MALIVLSITCFCSCKKGGSVNDQHTYLIVTWDGDSVCVKADSWNFYGTGVNLYYGGSTQYVSKCKHIIIKD